MSERFVALGMGRAVRADRVIALEPIEGADRGPGRRTRVWVDGLGDPIVASRSEAAILADLMGGVSMSPVPGARSDGATAADEPPSLF